MKRSLLFTIALATALALILSGCCFPAPASAPAASAAATTQAAETKAAAEETTAAVEESTAPVEETAAPTEEPTKAPAGEQQGTGTVGDYTVTIVDAKLAKDYEGKPAVVVTYEWTNNSKEAQMFMLAVGAKVFQDGIECENGILDLKSKVDTGAASKEIKPGITQTVYVAYVLSDAKKPVSIEVTALFSFDDNTKVVKEFSGLK